MVKEQVLIYMAKNPTMVVTVRSLIEYLSKRFPEFEYKETTVSAGLHSLWRENKIRQISPGKRGSEGYEAKWRYK